MSVPLPAPPPEVQEPISRAPERKPVYEPIEPQKAPAAKSPFRPFKEKEEQPVAKVPKLQQPTQEPQLYRDQIDLQIEGQQQELPPFEKRIALFKQQEEEQPPPLPKSEIPKKPLGTGKEKPTFIQVL